MKYRIEHDSMGEVEVREDRLWGAQTQRSFDNFRIGAGLELMPIEIIRSLALLKLASAEANAELCPKRMTAEKLSAIRSACEKIISGELDDHFPLVVWQTGSGTQTNMNVTEVIANYANREAGKKLLHPNDDVNMSQSSNDVFPSAMHVSALVSIENALIPALSELISELCRLEEENEGVIKCGRTHLQDATPIRFSAEISGWRSSLEKDLQMLNYAKETLSSIALGGTAVGSGLNAPRGFDTLVAAKVSALTHIPFLSAENKYHALSSKDELVFVHGALKALAADLMKIANDVRWLASGPRCGLGEITISENEPGSSIMPGKVNPTQCEAMTMVAVQVMANDVAVGLAASQGNFELNVYMPVCAYNFLQSCRLLADAMRSFRANCVAGIKANTDRMQSYLSSSLMLVTALNTHIGYENAAKIAKLAYSENITLKEAAEKLGLLSPDEFERIVRPENMA
jgi:fumarate hydratase class II